MNNLISFGIGFTLSVVMFSLGFLFANKMRGTKIWDYFATPSGNELELNWFGRQFFRLFSEGMSERWYESRAHLYRGVFISLLSTFHLIHLVRVDFGTSIDDRYSWTVLVVHGFQSLETLKKKHRDMIEKARTRVKDPQYYYQTFISGHNVVHDFMSGELA